MTPQFQVIGIGSPLLDVLARVDDAFLGAIKAEKGGMVLVAADEMARLVARLPAEPTRVPGGSAANTVCGLAHLGVACTFLGQLGQDDTAARYLAGFERLGIDRSRFKSSPDTPSGLCLGLVTPDTQRTFRTFLGAASTLRPEAVTVADFTGCRHAHIEGYLLFNQELIAAVLKAARAAGCTISLDLASFEVVRANRQTLPELLRQYVDVVFANQDEAQAFTGSADPTVGLAALAECCATVAVKLGADGAWLRRAGEQVRVPAERVKAVDTTGAGDAWAAGFLYGWLHGRPLAACGRYGAVLGAEVVQVMGAAIPEDRWPSIKERIG